MNKKRINLKSIVLSIGLVIIVIAIAITIIIINGIGIGILKAKVPSDHKPLEVAALRLNKVNTKVLKLNQKHLDKVVLTGKVLKSEVGLNAVAGVVKLKSKDKESLTAKVHKLEQRQLVSELKNVKSLLLDELNGDLGQLDLDSLQALLKLKPSLDKTGLLDRVV